MDYHAQLHNVSLCEPLVEQHTPEGTGVPSMAGLQWRDTSWAALLGREGPCGVGSLWVQQFRYLASRPLPRLLPHTWNTFAFCLPG